MPRITDIQLRHGTAAAWTSTNPVLDVGEAGVETDTHLIKIGDGSTPWNSLNYSGPYANFNTALQSAQAVAATPVYLAGSQLQVPVTQLVNKTSFLWDVAINKDANGTGVFQPLIYLGTNGTTADTQIAVPTGFTTTAAADIMTLEIQATVTLTGTSGTLYYSIVPTHQAAAGVGFGVPLSSAGHITGTTTAADLTRTGLIIGVGYVISAGGTMATIGVPQVQATSYYV